MYVLLSLGMGILALILPFTKSLRFDQMRLSHMSFGCMGVALIYQFLEIQRLSSTGDLASIDDFIGFQVVSAFVLVMLTLADNSVFVYKVKKS